ncbi:MAG TPA: 30S ribosomal protein S17 [Ignavibacteria bacterium]|nr:30S ribosomal protein S17 [Ignavibacteria bacterium]
MSDENAEITGTEEISKDTKVAEVKKTSSHSGIRKTRIGKVLSNKMDKTIIVSEEKRIMHPIYKKYFKKTTKFAAHDDKNTCDIGDKVKIMETRPLSKTKRWRLVEIIEKVK